MDLRVVAALAIGATVVAALIVVPLVLRFIRWADRRTRPVVLATQNSVTGGVEAAF